MEDGIGFVRYKARWLQLALFCLISMSNAMLWITFAPISDIAVDFYEVTPLAINSLSLVYMFMYIPMVFPAGLFLDRAIPYIPGGLRWGLTVGIIGSSLSAAVRAITNDFGVVWFGQFIGATVQPFILNAPPMLAANWFPEDQRTLATTICSVANPIGVALGFVMPPIIVNDETNKFQLLMGIQALMVSTVAIIAIIFLREKSPTAASASSEIEDRNESLLSTIITLLKDINFWILTISFGFGLGAFNTLATLLTQLVTPYNYTNIQSGSLGAIVVIAGLISSGILGAIVDKFHCYKWAIVSCFAMATVSLILFTTLLAPDRFWIVFACAFGIGFTMTPVLPLSLELAVEITYPLREATPSGILMCAGQLVGIFLIIEMDWLIKQSQIEWANASVSIGVGIGLLCMLFFRGKLKRLQFSADGEEGKTLIQ